MKGQKWLITKQDVLDFLDLGCSPSEIAECFSGFTVHQIAGWKSHPNLWQGHFRKR